MNLMDQFNEAWDKLSDQVGVWIDSLVLSLPNLVIAILVMIFTAFMARYVRKYAQKLIGRVTNKHTIISLVSSIVTVVFVMIMLFVILGILDLDKALNSLLAGAGVIGLAVGLALQDPLVNLFSGVIMSLRAYYREGDLIETNGFFGKIQKIDLRTTLLLRPDGQEVLIPNKDVLQQPLVNFSHNGRRRVDISCGVSYGDDLDKAKEIALNAIKESVEFNQDRPLELFYNEFGDSSINFTLRFWINSPEQGDFLSAQDSAIRAIKRAFDDQGITIPFPIRTLDFGIVGGERIDELYPAKIFESHNGPSAKKAEKKSSEDHANE